MDLLTRLREWGRRGGDLSSDPDPADRLAADGVAADLIQRPGARVVSIDRDE